MVRNGSFDRRKDFNSDDNIETFDREPTSTFPTIRLNGVAHIEIQDVLSNN